MGDENLSQTDDLLQGDCQCHAACSAITTSIILTYKIWKRLFPTHSSDWAQLGYWQTVHAIWLFAKCYPTYTKKQNKNRCGYTEFKVLINV